MLLVLLIGNCENEVFVQPRDDTRASSSECHVCCVQGYLSRIDQANEEKMMTMTVIIIIELMSKEAHDEREFAK